MAIYPPMVHIILIFFFICLQHIEIGSVRTNGLTVHPPVHALFFLFFSRCMSLLESFLNDEMLFVIFLRFHLFWSLSEGRVCSTVLGQKCIVKVYIDGPCELFIRRSIDKAYIDGPCELFIRRSINTFLAEHIS